MALIETQLIRKWDSKSEYHSIYAIFINKRRSGQIMTSGYGSFAVIGHEGFDFSQFMSGTDIQSAVEDYFMTRKGR